MVSPAVDRQSTPPGSTWPDCPPLEEVYDAARAAFPDVTLGGGMLSYFTELNRKRPPVAMLDFVSHCTCPIVHASDDVSVMQSLEALPDIVRSTRAIIGPDRPYRVGPSTIGMRQNPYGSRVIPNPDGVRMTMTDRDPRHRGLFAAAWTVGYVAATEAGELDGLVPAALTGRLGLAEAMADGTVVRHPAFLVVQALARMGGRPRLACRSGAPGRVLAIAGETADGDTLWIANITDTHQHVVLDGIGASRPLLFLGEGETVPDAVTSALASGEPVPLEPYAVLGLALAPRTVR
jgi:D-apionolactonase